MSLLFTTFNLKYCFKSTGAAQDQTNGGIYKEIQIPERGVLHVFEAIQREQNPKEGRYWKRFKGSRVNGSFSRII